MIRIAIVEDEDLEAKELEESLKRYEKEHDEVFDIQRYRNGLLFLSDDKALFDLIFLDVEMPMMDGLKTAGRIREKDSQVVLVFVTKLFQYAVNGYEYNAADFIIKPIRYASFSLKMDKIQKKCHHAADRYIQLKYSGGLRRLPVSELIYVELQGHRIIYHTDDGDLTYYGNGKQVEETLSEEDFFRCNSGYFVNLKRVTGLDGFTVSLGDTELQVSHSRKKAFMEALHTSFTRQR